MLKVGQVVMYRRSVCTVNEIIDNFRDNGNYYKLTPCYDVTLVIRAPIDSPDGVFKPLLSKDEVALLVSNIPNVACIEDTDTTLENTYKELFNSEKHEDLIRIIKTAYARKEQALPKGQKRSEKDKMYLQKAEKALYSELAVILGKSIADTRAYFIEQITATVV